MTRVVIYRWLNVIAFIAMITMNILANIIPIGGMTTGEISNKYQNLFTPAGITFSIWAIIYVLVGISLILNVMSRRVNADNLIQEIGPWFIISCVLNILWIFLWHQNEVLLSTIIIILLAITMFMLLGRVADSRLMTWGVGIYTGWISVASVASLFVLANSMGFDGLSTFASVITIIVIIACAIGTGIITMKLGCAPYGIAVLWALCGMLINHISTFDSKYPFVITSIVIAVIIEVVFVIRTLKYHLR